MLKLLLLTTVFVATSANICSFPEKWNSIQSVSVISVPTSGGAPHVLQSTQVINCDSSKNMFAIEGRDMYNGTLISYKLFYDFKEGKQYTAYPGSCDNAPLPVGTDAFGIPDNARLVRSGYIGINDRKLYVRTYEFIMYNGLTLQTTVDNNCFPVQELLYGVEKGTYNAYTIGIVNGTEGLSSPNALDLPKECKPPSSVRKHVIFGR